MIGEQNYELLKSNTPGTPEHLQPRQDRRRAAHEQLLRYQVRPGDAGVRHRLRLLPNPGHPARRREV